MPEGTYIVGKQVPNPNSSGNYIGVNIIDIQGCTIPVIIDLRGAVLKTPDGMKFGTFDDKAWQIGAMINVRYNADVTINGPFELDGNITAQEIGDGYGDAGTQLLHSGITAYNNQTFALTGAPDIHHFGLDGLAIGFYDLTADDPIYPHTIEGLKSLYNGRQGLSWVGGNHLHATDCEFSYTGKNGAVWSNPGAGLDIESEGNSAGISGGLFERCTFEDNAGANFVSDQTVNRDVEFVDCTFVGNTNYAVWGKIKRLKMTRCTVVGPVIALFPAESPDDAAEFTECEFSFLAEDSPTGEIYSQPVNLHRGNYAIYDRCTFDMGPNMGLPRFPVEADGLATIRDCVLKTESPDWDSWLRGNFYGENVIEHVRAGLNTDEMRNHGTLTINGVEQPQYED